MTLAELAALAAEKVPGFVRLVRVERWVAGERCIMWNDSPAALLMAVAMQGRFVVVDWREVSVARHTSPETIHSHCRHERTPESIACAALVALLRAHGVGVDCD